MGGGIAHFGQRGKKMAILCETVNSTAIGENISNYVQKESG